MWTGLVGREYGCKGVILELTPGRNGTRDGRSSSADSARPTEPMAASRAWSPARSVQRVDHRHGEINLSKRPKDSLRAAQGMTASQLIPRWLAHAEEFEGRSPSTTREYPRLAAVEVVPAIGQVRLD